MGAAVDRSAFEKSDIPQGSPPPYSEAADGATNRNITQSLANLDLTPSTDFPTPNECIAHLKLLKAIERIRRRVSCSDGVFAIYDTPTKQINLLPPGGTSTTQLVVTRERRWAVFVHRAVNRFSLWWNRVDVSGDPRLRKAALRHNQGHAGWLIDHGANSNWTQERIIKGHVLQIDKTNIPPLDVLMVWHAYLLNPRNFFEDCLRYGKMRLWRTGLPWQVIDSCIDPTSFEYSASPEAKISFENTTGPSWDNLSDPMTTSLKCPYAECGEIMQVHWTTQARSGHGSLDGRGLADPNFITTCKKCGNLVDNDALKLQKFRYDIEACRERDMPLPGTILTLDGRPADPSIVNGQRALYPTNLIGAPDKVSTTFRGQKFNVPNTLYHNLHKEMLQKDFTSRSVGIIRNRLGDGLDLGKKYITREEKIAIRKLMSNYWDNASPFSIELVGAVLRQGVFITKMGNLDWLHDPNISTRIPRLLQKYQRFMQIIASTMTSSGQRKKHVAVPTLDVDLAWHTHQLSPAQYYAFSLAKTDKFVDHDDKITDTKISESFAWTSKVYQKLFGEPYSECLCWYCLAVKESNTSSFGRLFKSTSNKKDVANVTTPQTGVGSGQQHPHLSTHNVIQPSDVDLIRIRERHDQKMVKQHQKALKRSGDGEKTKEEREARGEMLVVWDVPLNFADSKPYGPDPHVTPSLYAANPACATYTAGAAGSCVEGTCGGGVAAGSCGGEGAGACSSGLGAGSCGGGDAGGDGAGDGGGCGGGCGGD